jgi:hypothetical protein
LVVSSNGYGKTTPIAEYKTQNRGGSGIKTVKVTPKTGPLVAAHVVSKEEGVGEDEMVVMSKKGQVIRTGLVEIPSLSRSTQGVRIMKLRDGDAIRRNTKFTPGSLATYKYRVLRVLDHYEKYGADPTKMVNWKVAPRGTGKTKTSVEKKEKREILTLPEDVIVTPPSNNRRLEYPLSAGQVVILLPQSINSVDLKKIKTLLELIETKE